MSRSKIMKAILERCRAGVCHHADREDQIYLEEPEAHPGKRMALTKKMNLDRSLRKKRWRESSRRSVRV